MLSRSFYSYETSEHESDNDLGHLSMSIPLTQKLTTPPQDPVNKNEKSKSKVNKLSLSREQNGKCILYVTTESHNPHEMLRTCVQAAEAILSVCPWSLSLNRTTGRSALALAWNTASLWTGRRSIRKLQNGTRWYWRASTSGWKPWEEKDSGLCLIHWGQRLTITSSTASIPG